MAGPPTEEAAPRRKHGLQWPFDKHQIGAWVLFAVFAAAAFALYAPMMEGIARWALLGTYAALLAVVVALGAVASATDPSDPGLHGSDDGEFFCALCNASVGASSKHCRACNRCVEGFDHHCKWLNNCIGAKNYLTFFALLVVANLLLSLQFVWSIHLLARSFYAKDQMDALLEARYGASFPLVAWQVLIGVCLLMLAGAIFMLAELLSFHVVLVARDMTTYDYIMAQREAAAGNAPDPEAGGGEAEPKKHGARAALCRSNRVVDESSAAAAVAPKKKKKKVGLNPCGACKAEKLEGNPQEGYHRRRDADHAGSGGELAGAPGAGAGAVGGAAAAAAMLGHHHHAGASALRGSLSTLSEGDEEGEGSSIAMATVPHFEHTASVGSSRGDGALPIMEQDIERGVGGGVAAEPWRQDGLGEPVLPATSGFAPLAVADSRLAAGAAPLADQHAGGNKLDIQHAWSGASSASRVHSFGRDSPAGPSTGSSRAPSPVEAGGPEGGAGSGGGGVDDGRGGAWGDAPPAGPHGHAPPGVGIVHAAPRVVVTSSGGEMPGGGFGSAFVAFDSGPVGGVHDDTLGAPGVPGGGRAAASEQLPAPSAHAAPLLESSVGAAAVGPALDGGGKDGGPGAAEPPRAPALPLSAPLVAAPPPSGAPASSIGAAPGAAQLPIASDAAAAGSRSLAPLGRAQGLAPPGGIGRFSDAGGGSSGEGEAGTSLPRAPLAPLAPISGAAPAHALASPSGGSAGSLAGLPALPGALPALPASLRWSGSAQNEPAWLRPVGESTTAPPGASLAQADTDPGGDGDDDGSEGAVRTPGGSVHRSPPPSAHSRT